MRLQQFLDLPTHTVDLGHTRIAYRRTGDGPPLLFIHGWPLCSATYRKLLPRLTQHFECILPDSPGLGQSTWSVDTDFHFMAQAATWQRFVDAIDLPDYHLAAHNTGATIARLLAHSHADRVRKFVIFDTEIPNHRPPGASVALRVLRIPGSKWVLRRLFARRSWVESKYGFGYAYRDKSLFDGEFYAGYVQPLLEDERRWQGAMRYAMAIDWAVVDSLVEVHRDIRCPVQLIWGDKDRFFPVAGARAMVDQFHNCVGLVTLPNASLMSYEEQPDAAVDAMLAFLLDGPPPAVSR